VILTTILYTVYQRDSNRCLYITLYITSISFSDIEHQNIDWIGIHEKICQLLIPLKTASLSSCNSEEEREHQRIQKIIREVKYIKSGIFSVFSLYLELFSISNWCPNPLDIFNCWYIAFLKLSISQTNFYIPWEF